MRYFLTEVMIVRKKILNCASALEFDGDHFKDKTKIDPIKTEAQGVRDEYKTKLDGMHLEGKKYCSKYSPPVISQKPSTGTAFKTSLEKLPHPKFDGCKINYLRFKKNLNSFKEC